MFIKTIVKTDTKTKKRYKYFRLCESYRIDKKSRHRSILSLGVIPELNSPELKKSFADRLEQLISGAVILFGIELPPNLEVLAADFYKKYKEKNIVSSVNESPKTDSFVHKPDFDTIDLNSIESEEVKEIGSEWLCFQTLEQLGLGAFLRSLGWEEKAIKMALLHIISKAVVWPPIIPTLLQTVYNNKLTPRIFALANNNRR